MLLDEAITLLASSVVVEEPVAVLPVTTWTRKVEEDSGKKFRDGELPVVSCTIWDCVEDILGYTDGSGER